MTCPSSRCRFLTLFALRPDTVPNRIPTETEPPSTVPTTAVPNKTTCRQEISWEEEKMNKKSEAIVCAPTNASTVPRAKGKNIYLALPVAINQTQSDLVGNGCWWLFAPCTAPTSRDKWPTGPTSQAKSHERWDQQVV